MYPVVSSLIRFLFRLALDWRWRRRSRRRGLEEILDPVLLTRIDHFTFPGLGGRSGLFLWSGILIDAHSDEEIFEFGL